MNTSKILVTERLILLPGLNTRDSKPFLKMLREDGDFRMFCGVDPTEDRIQRFASYFEEKGNCLFSIYRKEVSDAFIGYVGVRYQKNRYEVEFYIGKDYRGNGYCIEALSLICSTSMSEGLSMDNKKIVFDEIHATTISDNIATIKTLEKCGFVKRDDVVGFNIYIDPSNNSSFDYKIAEYVLKKGKMAEIILFYN
ncbi:GNAT family N-acetyltransferase [Lachnospiraceae bacterium MD1]|uniref:GNAT family N-acetyltransferase n=1 Tax=Variimorphobacter saccharofermentans TaxID=2755051 RepID=A0A839JZG9_9FIRM|nr:GNAT family N-acetyltransferase [Variimorphobacter saccharofermentans]MBB2182800.1 GNAT family N-acetyltransferase [Variimorphobacter saccharofermentans]